MSDPCSICQGACCESLVFPSATLSETEREFLLTRGTRFGSGQIQVESRCPKLGAQGQCTCYATRPTACRTYKVGSQACLDTIDARRFGDQRKAILEAILIL